LNLVNQSYTHFAVNKLTKPGGKLEKAIFLKVMFWCR